MFLHQKGYEVHTLYEDIFYHTFQFVKHVNGTLLVLTLMLHNHVHQFGIQLPSFNFNKILLALMVLCKTFLRCMYFTAGQG